MDAQITRTNVSKIHRPLLAAASPTPDATTEPVPKLTLSFFPGSCYYHKSWKESASTRGVTGNKNYSGHLLSPPWKKTRHLAVEGSRGIPTNGNKLRLEKPESTTTWGTTNLPSHLAIH
jgi:hypothetical protein